MIWSVDGQTPEYLELTRIANLAPDTVAAALRHLEIEPGMRVLEVGCGTGEYSFRIGSVLCGVEFVGLDYDQQFVDLANEKAAGEQSSNSYRFVQGDGTCLPFDDGEFDAVISHTYLTAVPDHEKALAEMVRVCKKGGQVSSVTAMGPNYEYCGNGFTLIPPYELMTEDERQMVLEAQEVSRQIDSVNLAPGISTWTVQHAFAAAGLGNVNATALGQYFCLSDARVPSEVYRRFADLLYVCDMQGVANMRKSEAGEDVDWTAYEKFLATRHQHLLDIEGANDEWSWYGSAALLVWGTKING